MWSTPCSLGRRDVEFRCAMRGTMGRYVPFFRATMCIHMQCVEETTGGLCVPTQCQMLLVGQQQTDPVLRHSTLHASSIGLSDSVTFTLCYLCYTRGTSNSLLHRNWCIREGGQTQLMHSVWVEHSQTCTYTCATTTQ